MPITLGNSDTLYIRIGKGRFVFTCYDRVKDNTLNYRCFDVNKNMSLNANMHKALASHALMGEGRGRVYVSVDTPVTLVPLNEFDDEEMPNIYSYNFPDENNRMHVLYDMLPLQNAVMLGAVDKDLEHTILETYPGATFHPSLTPLILHYASLCDNTSQSGKMFVSFMEDDMTIACFRGNKISSLNTFSGVKNIENALYYTLSVARQGNINPESYEVYIVGNGALESSMCKELHKYLPQTFLFEPENAIRRYVQVLEDNLPYDMIVLLLKAY